MDTKLVKKRHVLTIATGKALYVELAANLARSFFHWHPETCINFQIVTDRPELIPIDVFEKSQVILVKENELGEGFSTKLQLDKVASEGQTLFIDSDCLIFGNLEPVFDRFNGKFVSVIGTYISEGEWFGDITHICNQFNIPKLPKFNGGIYYLEKSETADKVYKCARELEEKYDEIGFIRLRNRPNDEVIMALAMQLNQQSVVNDDGTIMSDPQACRGKYSLDVISGERILRNPPNPSILHQSWYPFSEVRPLIVHFLGYYTQHYPYRREVSRLKVSATRQLNLFDEIFVKTCIEYPARIKLFFKDLLRPFYHKLFKPRMVKKSQRI